jgi:Tfp pilus assembly PilM family ATPase
MTNAEMKNALKHTLATNAQWALRALVRIYANQTAAERSAQTTKEFNGIGFNGTDAQLLSSFAEQYNRRGSLSEKQMAYVFKKMPKYWGQLVTIAGKEKMAEALAKLTPAQA